MNTPLALIVGAGPTGMTLAIELKRAGFAVRIIDKSNHLALHSQALVVQARTLEQFQRYGIAGEAVAQGRKITRAAFWSEGKQIGSFAFEKIQSRYPYLLFLPQNKTEAILNQRMESLGVKTERGVELVSLAEEANGCAAVLRGPDGREEKLEARWVVGCDGAHSTVRSLRQIPFEGKGIGLSFFLGDLEIEGPDAPTDELALHLHAGDVVFLAKLTEKFTRVIVALHSAQGDQSDRQLSIQDFQDAVDKSKVRVKIRSAEWMTPFHVHDLQAKQYREGNVFLAGDASHIHSPVGGQGMNTGIQDAANLAWKLAAVARGANPVLLDSYEEERGAVGRALLRFTERGLKLATAQNPLLEGIRDALLPFLSGSRMVQNAAVGFISETAIEYRSSSVVSDHGGDGSLRAGDRMPDLGMPKRGENQSLLRNWTDGKHLALTLEATASETGALAGQLKGATVVSINAADLDQEGRRILGVEKKIVVVRPDGYVGFRAPLSKNEELQAYARQDGLASPSAA